MLLSRFYSSYAPELQIFLSVIRRAVAPFLLLAVGVLVSSCGYSPLYGRAGTKPGVVQDLAGVEIAIIPDRMGQMLRTALKRRLTPYGSTGQQPYTLKIRLQKSIAQVAINKASFATRTNLRVTANFELLRNQDRKTVYSGQPFSVTSYNILDSNFATLAAQADARKRAVENLADEIHTRLAIYFQKPAPNRNPGNLPTKR